MTEKLEKDVQEIKDRCRRIETRFTKFLEAQGFETQVRPPVWDEKASAVVVPSIAIALKDVLEVVPVDWAYPVAVLHRRELIATIIISNTREV